MELVGKEKKIQALFRELRLEDERLTPRFVAVWPSAPARTPARWSLNFSYAAIALVVVVSVLALAFWSRSSRQIVQPKPEIAVAPSVTPAPIPVEQPRFAGTTGEPRRVSRNSRVARFAARRRAELAARLAITRDAVAISSWESPTAKLLNSQNDELIKSLPQLNENAKDLKSFLPDK